MRSLRNNLGDPGLHLLVIALIMAYLAFGGPWRGANPAEAPLPYCKACHLHFLPEKACDCRRAGHIAHALP